MGVKIVDGAFAGFVILLAQHGKASSKYFGERHSWPITFTSRSGGRLLERY